MRMADMAKLLMQPDERCPSEMRHHRLDLIEIHQLCGGGGSIGNRCRFVDDGGAQPFRAAWQTRCRIDQMTGRLPDQGAGGSTSGDGLVANLNRGTIGTAQIYLPELISF